MIHGQDPNKCGLADRTIAECSPPIEPHSNPERCGICGRHIPQTQWLTDEDDFAASDNVEWRREREL